MPKDDRPDSIRRGWARRLASTARVATSAARLAITGRDGDGRIGETLAHELDQMKGMAMKVGQILSYFDGILPPETHAALHRLQRGASPVAFATMAGVIEDALGAPPPELFERFDPEPIAAASIGQVYRARHRGREVAVKVQYPGIRDTMLADLGRMRGLSRIASLASAVDGPSLVAELGARMASECDYLFEARAQRAFRAAYAADPEVYVPEVIDERTAATVITSEWIDGRDFYELTRADDGAARTRVGLTLARIAYGSFYGLGTLNADPHPGNYLFPDSGRIVLIDFGCVRAFERGFIEGERALARVVVEDRRSDFRDAAIATGTVAKPDRFDFDHHWRMLCHLYAPYRAPRFAFTSDYIRRGMEYNGPSSPNARLLSIPPPWIWFQRLIWGLHAVLARLGADGPFADVFRAALDRPLAPEPLVPLPDPA
ncbi:ABC1 kinase family protein [Haliangium sp.]|uniref:ABC1 kinase family protein n=1 Tax=Haliangium sp. TaxID=2663208 RepID=UPI003D12CC7E